MVPAVEFDDVSRHFDAVRAVDGASFTVPEGSFFAMLGPSGSGKTTCLRLISGFEKPSGGQIRIFGVDCGSVPPNRRNVNTVFQDYALFPHMNVRENVAYGPMVRGVDRRTRESQAEELLSLVRLEGFGGRKPSELSGGQRQRVALARALINRPRVLLLDEPLGALDLKLRESMQDELKALQQRLGITFVFVTHDQGEALSMADQIAVFNLGRVVQVGRPSEVYDRPRTRFVADFVGSSNVLSPEMMQALGATGRLASLRPEKVHLVEPDAGRLQGRITAHRYLGTGVRVGVAVPGGELGAYVPAGRAVPEPGSEVGLYWEDGSLHFLEED
jgi:putative spermidine/putrescine transport system ATP-binding protein